MPGAEVARAVLDDGVVQEAAVEEEARAEAGADDTPAGGGRFITNRGSGVTHATAPGWHDRLPICDWRARCGWGFGGANGVLATRRPVPPFCRKCFPDKPPERDESAVDSEG